MPQHYAGGANTSLTHVPVPDGLSKLKQLVELSKQSADALRKLGRCTSDARAVPDEPAKQLRLACTACVRPRSTQAKCQALSRRGKCTSDAQGCLPMGPKSSDTCEWAQRPRRTEARSNLH